MPVTPLRLHLPDTAPVRGEFVLYWMQSVFRAHHNFALNFAIDEANRLGLPVLVYQGLRRDYPWASDRFHTFILESVVDVAADLAARGVPYAFWLDEAQAPGARWGLVGDAPAAPAGEPPPRDASPLVALAARAALVVTDFSPTFVHPRQLRGLRAKIAAPVVAVESATVVPMRIIGRAHATARGIRTVLMDALPTFLFAPSEPTPRHRADIDLPFAPTVVTPDRIAALVAGCAIDHTVAPAPGYPGGTAAARARLHAFLATGLSRYAADRGDPNVDATSRLSPYLHFGNVSPHEVLLAVQAADAGEDGDKFVDEALVWRELAHNFCFHDPHHRTVAAIPDWARAELGRHEADPRPAAYTYAQLRAAATDSPLWNVAMRQYLRDGFMHNYLRMLWGKAVIQWTPDAATALAWLEDLNNRYSLDGRDPSTYGGLHWVFGKFDRPFYRHACYGTVRYMSLPAAAKKFDVGALLRRYPA